MDRGVRYPVLMTVRRRGLEVPESPPVPSMPGEWRPVHRGVIWLSRKRRLSHL